MVRFRVEATLRTEPDPERVEFDTVLELATKRFEVSRKGHV
jgi:predicted component of type VI protein secretion system